MTLDDIELHKIIQRRFELQDKYINLLTEQIDLLNNSVSVGNKKINKLIEEVEALKMERN